MDCVRSITFIIPGVGGAPDVQILAVEVDGAIEFTVDVLTTADGVTADLRGLFFDVSNPSILSDLDAAGSDVTEFDTDDVIDLGNGANMRGAAAPFDVGVEFGQQGIGKNKGDIQTTTFTLSNEAGDLTLDDLAQVEFGARLTSVGQMGGDRDGSAKLTTVAPAAPDAVDDVYNIFEDGQDGLDDPSDVSEGVVFNVLDNDTDADGDTLTITEVHDVMHGTVEIIDGDDADLLPGDALFYTPDTDYSGPDEFTYCITDNNGGTDFAIVQVAIAAVADIPDVSIEAFATDEVNEIRLVVTATQTDDDNSEFIQNLISSALPAGVTLTPVGPGLAGQPTEHVQEYLLTLPLDTDTDFDLTFTATAEEMSNGDTETNSATISIESDFETNSDSLAFVVDDQSIWDSGGDFEFDTGVQFLGVDTGYNSGGWGGDVVGGSYEYDLRIGFEQQLEFEGGSIDATIPYDISVDYFYNKTTDVLSLDPMFGLADGGGFLTDGPSLAYALDFVFDILIGGNLTIAGVDLGGSVDVANSLSIVDYDSETDPPFELGDEDDSFSGTIAWPELNVMDESQVGDVYTGDGESDNALTFNLDADQLIADIFLGGANPFDFGIDAFSETFGTGAAINLELLDVDLFAGARFDQEFVLDGGDVDATIVFEDGSTFEFDLTSETQFANASSYDLNGDEVVEFELLFDMGTTTLSNDTDLVLSVGADLDLLSYSYKAGIAGIVTEGGDTIFDLAPAEADVASINVYENDFALAVGGDEFEFFA